jgi:hypothetical protein
MMGIVSQAIPSDNGDAYTRGLAQARGGIERAVAARLPPDASCADRERAVLAAMNEAGRFLLAGTLHATADAHPGRVRVEGVVYARHHMSTVTYLSERLPTMWPYMAAEYSADVRAAA